jgi:DNA-directed RNA polymerase subunit F
MTTKPKIIEETEMSMVDVSAEIAKIRKRDGELNFRAQKTEEYLSQFSMFKPKEADEIKQKIAKLNIPRLKEGQILKIIDIMPKNLEELKIVMQSYTVTVSDDNMKKIVEILAEYLPKKK